MSHHRSGCPGCHFGRVRSPFRPRTRMPDKCFCCYKRGPTSTVRLLSRRTWGIGPWAGWAHQGSSSPNRRKVIFARFCISRLCSAQSAPNRRRHPPTTIFQLLVWCPGIPYPSLRPVNTLVFLVALLLASYLISYNTTLAHKCGVIRNLVMSLL